MIFFSFVNYIVHFCYSLPEGMNLLLVVLVLLFLMVSKKLVSCYFFLKTQPKTIIIPCPLPGNSTSLLLLKFIVEEVRRTHMVLQTTQEMLPIQWSSKHQFYTTKNWMRPMPPPVSRRRLLCREKDLLKATTTKLYWFQKPILPTLTKITQIHQWFVHLCYVMNKKDKNSTLGETSTCREYYIQEETATSKRYFFGYNFCLLQP